MHIGTLIIGDEILTGRRNDKHLAHVIEALASRGLGLAWARYAGDDEALLQRELREIQSRADLCFCFGGIGATPDDRTRQAVAVAHGVALRRHPDAVREIEARFGDAAYPNRILMADLPEGASIVPNPFNRIPGFSLDHIHCLPGFPEMAWPMLDWVLDERYPGLRAEKPAQYVLVLQGVHESESIDLMTAIIHAHPKVKVSSLPRFLPDGGREIELGVRGPERDAAAALEALKGLLRARSQPFAVP
jgi:molybdopterin-biosynthesis enzyme MoeA-like protein